MIPSLDTAIRFCTLSCDTQRFKRFCLKGLKLDAGVMAMFLYWAVSLRSLSLDRCEMDSSQRKQRHHQGARHLAAALQRNTNMENLNWANLKDGVLLPILRSLGESLNVLRYSPRYTNNSKSWLVVSLAIQSFLGSTTFLRRFELTS